jgi:hypothetical protein
MHRNTANELLEKDVRRTIIMFENRSLYQGFNLLVEIGMASEKTKWIKDYGRTLPGKTDFFVQLKSEAN